MPWYNPFSWWAATPPEDGDVSIDGDERSEMSMEDEQPLEEQSLESELPDYEQYEEEQAIVDEEMSSRQVERDAAETGLDEDDDMADNDGDVDEDVDDDADDSNSPLGQHNAIGDFGMLERDPDDRNDFILSAFHAEIVDLVARGYTPAQAWSFVSGLFDRWVEELQLYDEAAEDYHYDRREALEYSIRFDIDTIGRNRRHLQRQQEEMRARFRQIVGSSGHPYATELANVYQALMATQQWDPYQIFDGHMTIEAAQGVSASLPQDLWQHMGAGADEWVADFLFPSHGLSLRPAAANEGRRSPTTPMTRRLASPPYALPPTPPRAARTLPSPPLQPRLFGTSPMARRLASPPYLRLPSPPEGRPLTPSPPLPTPRPPTPPRAAHSLPTSPPRRLPYRLRQPVRLRTPTRSDLAEEGLISPPHPFDHHYAPIGSLPYSPPMPPQGIRRSPTATRSSPLTTPSTVSAVPLTPAGFDSFFRNNRPSKRPQSRFRDYRVAKVDPLRYLNRLYHPRRLPNTPTKSHQPPSPRRKGPKKCEACGRAFRPRKRKVTGRSVTAPRRSGRIRKRVQKLGA